MIGVAAEGIIQLLFHVIIEIFFIGTGEIILYIISLRKRKPVWKREGQSGSTKLAIFMDLSFIIGFLFWLTVAGLLFR